MKAVRERLSSTRLVKDFENTVQTLSGIVFCIEANDEALGILADRIDPREWDHFKESLREIGESLFQGDDGVRH